MEERKPIQTIEEAIAAYPDLKDKPPEEIAGVLRTQKQLYYWRMKHPDKPVPVDVRAQAVLTEAEIEEWDSIV